MSPIARLTNTRLRYMYRTWDNYKIHGETVFEGLERPGDILTIRGQRFIPKQVGLTDLAELEGWDSGDVHWHEMLEIEPTNAPAEHGPWADFVNTLRTITWNDGSRGPWGTELPGYGSISAYLSDKDGVLVIEIDTPEAPENGNVDSDGRPKMRVLVNDDPVWENPPYPAE